MCHECDVRKITNMFKRAVPMLKRTIDKERTEERVMPQPLLLAIKAFLIKLWQRIFHK